MNAESARIESIDACLPQTQCTRCGYPSCHAYAQAIARDETDINQCPPGDEATIAALARLLSLAPKPLNPRHGRHEPRRRAVIDESRCIGCRKCLDVCPVDAIVGAHKFMHIVIAGDCTGCELCLPPCPVDCIQMVEVGAASAPTLACCTRTYECRGRRTRRSDLPRKRGRVNSAADEREELWLEYSRDETETWRAKTDARLARLTHLRGKRARGGAVRTGIQLRNPPAPAQMRVEIQAAIARVKRKRASPRAPET
jgi:electron transport complex protein RnfB